MTIHLLNKNDNPPVFNKSSYNFNIRENNTVGQLLQPDRIYATDADGDPLQYTISNPCKFTIQNCKLTIRLLSHYAPNWLVSFTINMDLMQGCYTVIVLEKYEMSLNARKLVFRVFVQD